MAKGFTPIIGLAVVVALAMVAVFGAMSLTNPAFAAVGQPADAELAERTFSPQVDDTVEIVVGEQEWFDIADEIPDYTEDSVSAISIATDDADIVIGADAAADTDHESGAYDLGRSLAEVGLKGVKVGSGIRVTLTVTRTGGLDEVTVVLEVNVVAAPDSMAATTVGRMPNVDVEERTAAVNSDPAEAGTARKIDASDYFEDGTGPDGGITGYTVAIIVPANAADSPVQLNLSNAEADVGDWGTADLDSDDGVFWIRADETLGVKDTNARIQVTANDDVEGTDGEDPTQAFYVDVVADAPSDEIEGLPFDGPTFTPDSMEPGDGTRYDIAFKTTKDVNTLTDELTIKLSDFDLPSTIATRSVAIIVTDAGTDKATGADASKAADANRDFIPEDVTVSGSKVIITLGDMDKGDDNEDFGISEGSIIKVVLRQSAGISNPSEAKSYGPVITLADAVDLDWEEQMEVDGEDEDKYPMLVMGVPRIISLDEEDGGLGTVVNATGKGYKNGTSLIVFVDKPSPVTWNDPEDDRDRMVPLPANMVDEYDMRVMMNSKYGNVPVGKIPSDDGMATYYYEDDNENKYALAPNRELDLGEDELCQVRSIGGDDTGTCEFIVTHPTFDGGINYINAVDGRSGYVDDGEDLGEFDLTASITASPAGGSPGEIMLVQVVDFPFGNIKKVEISRTVHCSGGCGTVDRAGSGNFKVTIPNWVNGGVQELRVTGEDDAAGDPVRASTNVTLVGPQILVTPQTVLANQRISLVGTGFSPNAEIDDDVEQAKVSVGGDQISWGRVNEGEQVDVDSGGNWSASVDLPLTEATTAEGERVIRVTDSDGRSGTVMVDIPAREVTITPSVGRVGTIAVVRGSGFPSKNDEGTSFNVEIVYDASNDKTTTVSAVPDASGRFEVQLRIPTTAAIPSNNTVKVTFEDESGIAVVTTVAHEVPEGVITLSTTSGGPGSTVTINGEGFKAFVPVSLVKVGTLDVTPAPKPSTDGNGMMSFSVIIPGLDTGIQTIEVNVGRTTSSTGFTVTESGVNPGDIKEVAVGLEPLGDNFVSVWHFNNDTKMWSFYTPALEEGNSLTHLITGETYLIRMQVHRGGHPEQRHQEPDLRGRQLLEPVSLVRQGQE